MFYSRVLLSVADALFWVIIIVCIGVTFWIVFKKICDYLLEDVELDEEGRPLFPKPERNKSQFSFFKLFKKGEKK